MIAAPAAPHPREGMPSPRLGVAGFKRRSPPALPGRRLEEPRAKQGTARPDSEARCGFPHLCPLPSPLLMTAAAAWHLLTIDPFPGGRGGIEGEAMTDDVGKEGRIRDRAYAIWESEGRPDGHHERHWHEASRAMEEGDASDDAGSTSLPDDSEADEARPGGTAVEAEETAKAVEPRSPNAPA